MRKFFLYSFISIALFTVFILVLFANAGVSEYSSKKDSDFLKVFNFINKRTQNFLKPKIDQENYNLDPLVIGASSAISYDMTDDKLLFAKNSRSKLPIASLTKIMTAVVALETQGVNDVIVVSHLAAAVGENSMGISEGERYTLKELLYGLMLPSGNDAAEAIAENSKYGRDNFILLMNKKAKDLGLTDTHFNNPSGLEDEGKQYSTAYDLMTISKYALLIPEFAEIVATYNYEIPYSEDHKYLDLYNETNLLTSYPGVKGVKIGFTNDAGQCLVSYLEYKGRKIIAVILNSPDRRDEMKKILDYSLRIQGIAPPPHS